MYEEWYATATCKPCGLQQWRTTMDKCTGCGNSICHTCLPFIKQTACVICLKHLATCCGIGHVRCQKNYRQWLGTEGLHRPLRTEDDLTKHSQAFDEAKFLLFEIQLENGVLVWPTRWEETNIFPDKRIPGGVMASTLLTVCCAGVTGVEQPAQMPHRVTKRFSVLKIKGEIVADETLDFPIGAIAYHYCAEKGLISEEPLRLTIADTVPALEPHCKPKLNHIDPFPVYPISSAAKTEQTDTDEAPGQETEFTWEELEARTDSSDEEAPKVVKGFSKKRKGKQLMRLRIQRHQSTTSKEAWLRRKNKEVDEKWKARGYLLRCAVTTGGHSRPIAY